MGDRPCYLNEHVDSQGAKERQDRDGQGPAELLRSVTRDPDHPLLLYQQGEEDSDSKHGQPANRRQRGGGWDGWLTRDEWWHNRRVGRGGEHVRRHGGEEQEQKD